MKIWRNFETTNPNVKDEVRKYLRQNHIYNEVSECFDGWHFEILCDDIECENANRFLDSLYGMEA